MFQKLIDANLGLTLLQSTSGVVSEVFNTNDSGSIHADDTLNSSISENETNAQQLLRLKNPRNGYNWSS